jgi:hypothetical protein
LRLTASSGHGSHAPKGRQMTCASEFSEGGSF